MKKIAYHFHVVFGGGLWAYLKALLENLDRQKYSPVVYFFCKNQERNAEMRRVLTNLDVPILELNEEGEPGSNHRSTAIQKGWMETDMAKSQKSNLRETVKKAILFLLPSTVKRYWFYWKRIKKISDIYKSERIDIFHFVLGYYPRFEIPIVASMVSGIPTRILDINGGPALPCDRENQLFKILKYFAGSSGKHIRVPNQRVKRELREWWKMEEKRMSVIEFGVESEKFTEKIKKTLSRAEMGIGEAQKILVLSGRMSEEKGHSVLLKALLRVKEEAQKFICLFVGEGPLEQELKNQVATWGLSGQVRFLGFQHDVRPFLNLADLVVVPSSRETGPISVLEGMAAGKPVIATDVGAVPQMIVEKETGMIVPTDNPQALADAIIKLLLKNDEELNRMGELGRQRVRTYFTQDRCLQRTFSLYEEEATHL